jgi:hypothetical protein
MLQKNEWLVRLRFGWLLRIVKSERSRSQGAKKVSGWKKVLQTNVFVVPFQI